MIVPDWRSHIEPWLIARADAPPQRLHGDFPWVIRSSRHRLEHGALDEVA
jgi:hypothetical protein